MMRLLDRILAGEKLFARSAKEKGGREKLFRDLSGSQLVVIDNVADYVCELSTGLTPADFPCLALPFPNVFFDMRVNKSSYLYPAFDAAGVWMTAMSKTDVSADIKNPKFHLLLQREGVTAILMCALYVRERGYREIAEVTYYVIPITEQGAFATPESGKLELGHSPTPPDHWEVSSAEDLWDALMNCVLAPALLALSFMHCKNVKVVRENPPPKLSKVHERKTGKPLLRYHMLQIDHMKEILGREGRVGETGLKRALHICRGHFSAYGGEYGKGLLFGKHEGRFWIPMHTRGTRKEGVVVKDYEVK